MLDKAVEQLQRAQVVQFKIEAVSLDSTSVKVHPDGTGARKVRDGPQAIGKACGGGNTKIHLVAADTRSAIAFLLSPGHAQDVPRGRELLRRLGAPSRLLHLVMDRAYKGNETRQLALLRALSRSCHR